MGVGTVFFETAASALFLSRFEASWLPYVYVAAAAVNLVVGLGYSALLVRTSFARMMAGTLAFLLLTTLALRAGLLVSDAAWLVFLLLVWYRVISILTDLEFWAVASRLYDVRQAKRLFGFVGSGDVVARIACAFSVPFLVPHIGVANLLVLSAAGLLGCLVLGALALRTGERAREVPRPGEGAVPVPSRPPLRVLLAPPYVRVVVALAFFGVLAKYLVDFAFLDQMRSRFVEVGTLASFFAVFSGVSQALSLLTRLLLSGRLLARFGVRVGLLILPVAHVACTALVLAAALTPELAAAVFWLVVANQGLYKTFKQPIDNPSFKVLYQPLPREQRFATQVAVETLVTPLTIGLAGAVMILTTRPSAGGAAPLALVMLIVFAAWLLAATRGGRDYAGALLQALRGRIVDDSPFAYDDAKSRAVLEEALESDRAGDVLFALDLLERSGQAPGPAVLARLLEHPAAEVRAAVLERLESARTLAAMEAVSRRTRVDPDPAVRALAVRCLCALGGAEEQARVAAFLEDPHPEVRSGALVGLLRAGDARALPGLGRLVGADKREDRVLAARVIGQVGLPELRPSLRVLLEDRAPEVRRVSLLAAGRQGDPELFRVVVRQLADRAVRGAAASALLGAGVAAAPALTEALGQRPQGRLALDLARLLGRTGGRAAWPTLLGCLEAQDPGLRAEALAALRTARYLPDDPARDLLRAHVEKELAWAFWTQHASHGLTGAPSGALLSAALAAESHAARDRVLLLLSFLGDPARILLAREILMQGAPEKRAFALEVLDLALAGVGDLRKDVLLLFEDRGGPPSSTRSPSEWIQDVLRQAPRLRPWTVTTAHHAAAPGQGERMLTIERVMCLKAVQMFEETPEETLADVAAVLEEVVAEPGQLILEKGAPGDSMYVVVEGRVRVFDGPHTIATLGEREIFGELALLDPEPRLASVEAVVPTRLFRLDREAFSELMAGNIEIVRGVLHVLCERLRRPSGPAPSGQST